MKEKIIKTEYRALLLIIMILLSGQTLIKGQTVFMPDSTFEKISFVTDRDLYLSGETVRFSVDCKSKTGASASSLSKIIYSELFNSDHKVIAQDKFLLTDGKTSGYINIPHDNPTGCFYLRIYTQYLRNFSPEIIPLKLLTIINPKVPLSYKNDNSGEIIKIHTDGKMVYDLPAKIGLRINTNFLENIESLALYNQDSAIITDIEYLANGLGQFEFTPNDSSAYYLKTKFVTGDSIISELPGISSSGIITSLEIKDGILDYKIQSKENDNYYHDKPFYLSIYSVEYSKQYQKQIRIIPTYSENFNAKGLPEGLLYFVLKDQENNIIDIEIAYNIQEDPFLLTVVSDKETYQAREQVKISFSIPDIDVEAISDLSINVVKKGTVSEIQKLLPSYLIDNPIMISQELFNLGTINYDILKQIQIALIFYQETIINQAGFINELDADKVAIDYLPENRNITISGILRNKSTKNPVEGSNVLLSFVGKDNQIHIYETREDGSFIFPIVQYKKSQDLFLCTFDYDENQELLINNDYSQVFPKTLNVFPEIDTNDRALIEELYINQQIQQNNTGIVSLHNTRSDTPILGFGTPEISIRLEDYIDLPSMEVVLNEIVPYVKVRKRKGNYRLTILDSETGLSYDNHLIMVDNIPLGNVNELMRIHPGYVEQVDVINRTYFLGDHSFQGILLVKTKTNNFGGVTMPPDAVFLEYPLITPDTIYQEVSYEHYSPTSKKEPDFRTLLYWNPGFDPSSENELKFYTSDHNSEYIITIQGYNQDGQKIYGESSFQVKSD